MSKANNLFPKLSIILILILFIFLGAVKLDYDRALLNPNSDSGEKSTIEIKEGETVQSILDSLVENGLLKERFVYYAKFYIRVNDLGTKLQAGVYELPKNLSLKELIDALQTGRSEDVWVSIPEGLRKDEIAKIVGEELSKYTTSNFSVSEFLSLTTDTTFIESLGLTIDVSDLEGFLFPDKYAFPREIDSREVIEILVENFKTKVGDNKYSYQDIILASIVEREGYNGNDRPIIAGIIIKRFNEGWLLQTDATLLYPVKDWKHIITIQDKDDDNPYNTYKKIGLPPTPICNPGLQSIKAVWQPVESAYYYYIHDTNKNPHYGKTLDEHNSNVNKYLR